MQITEDYAAQLRGQIGNGITALDLLRDDDLTEAERHELARIGTHGLNTALQTIERLTRERDAALGNAPSLRALRAVR